MAVANDQLRVVRERTASPTHPDECLSRQELAELVNAYIWDHHDKLVELSANYVGKLERGLIRWPSKLYREALRAILGAPTDFALGFINARRAVVKLADADRKQFSAQPPWARVPSPLAPWRLCWRTASPPRSPFGSAQRKSDRSAPPLECSPAGITPMVVGWREKLCWPSFAGRLACSTPLVRPSWTVSCSQRSATLGTPAHSWPSTPTPTRMLFMAYYDDAQHAGDTGHALFDLAMLGRNPAEATNRLSAAVAGHTASYARSRAISQTKLASLTMAIGDPVEAAAIGTAALDAAGTIRSRRAADDLRELVRHCTRHSKVDEVAALRQRIIITLVRT
ncbi:MAG: hypothetical protein ACRDTH_28325 [Pseudonocardiaceae bacterium]